LVFNIAIHVTRRPQNTRTFPFVWRQPVLTTGNSPAGQTEFLKNQKKVPRLRQFNIASGLRLRLHCRVLEQLSVANRCRLEIFYSGRVQGVGFRYTAKTVATGFEVSGMVRNLSDGRVALIAEGAREELEAFRAAIRDAGLKPFIRGETVTWNAAQNEFRGFEIVH
jgi:acylphosphatase